MAALWWAVVPGLLQEGKPGPDIGELLDDVVRDIHGSHGLIVYVGSEAGDGLVLLHDTQYCKTCRKKECFEGLCPTQCCVPSNFDQANEGVDEEPDCQGQEDDGSNDPEDEGEGGEGGVGKGSGGLFYHALEGALWACTVIGGSPHVDI